jgi:hypothetical protein
MAAAANPFDDSFEETKVSTNPFDDNDGTSSFPPPTTTVSDDDLERDEASDENGSIVEAGSPAEASWQYLGDLPYRRVPIYSNVRWERKKTTEIPGAEDLFLHGLAAFPPAALKHHPKILDPREVRTLLANTTVTKVQGCPNGGPVAAVTLPLVGGTAFTHTELRILTCSGKPLAQLDFPPQYLDRRYAPGDIMTLGFTSRTTLIVILRDSLCLTFDLKGDPVLHPFHILPRGENEGTELLLATVYDGGVAVLGTNKDAALVELLDEHDDDEYLQTAHIGARHISPASVSEIMGHQNVTPPHYALVTPLPTAAFAMSNYCHYCAIAVLPRERTTSRHPEVFLSTSDNSVVVIDTSTTDITDVNCRTRIGSPIADMCFAPNGRFLACFTESSMMTVISTSFETKVLDFDCSDGTNSPPLEMKWCGEDRYAESIH